MNQIILKNEILEIIKCKRNWKPIENIKEMDLISEMDNCLDMLNKINDMIKASNNDQINLEDYNSYIDLLEKENYEEMKKYKIV